MNSHSTERVEAPSSMLVTSTTRYLILPHIFCMQGSRNPPQMLPL